MLRRNIDVSKIVMEHIGTTPKIAELACKARMAPGVMAGGL
jgi:hypothetical protein